MSLSQRKCRTRAHVIADLGVNYTERRVLECGWTVQRFNPDYGLDLLMTTFNRQGEIENGDVRLQVKATDTVKVLPRQKVITVRLEWRDMVYWLNEPLPVILVVYHAKADRAWYLHLNDTLREEGRKNPASAKVSVSVPLTNTLDRKAVRKFRTFRDRALVRTRG